MCGIAGVFGYRSTGNTVNRDELETMTEFLRPRGPDDGGTWVSADSRVGLGARRLAIIDLTRDGAQPMADQAEELRIVFNGEIYNHRELRVRLQRRGVTFRSTSDTEVLLEMYRHHGEEMLELLRGMYAFAIWDERRQRMFVARDPYGIKPLYVADDGSTLRFASTVKALLAGGAVSKTSDPAGLAGFWLTGSVPEPYTIYSSIRAVEAGTSFMIGREGERQDNRHYSIPATLRRGGEQETIANLVYPPTLLRELVTESLRAHLVSDVPVGAFLSSGIDSTALVALAAAQGGPPHTITVRFDEYRGGQNDEAPLAERFARELGSPHTTRLITRAEFLQALPAIFDAMDQPTIDGVNTWFVSETAAAQGLKVALSGLGGDELFGSYPSFRSLQRLMHTARTPLAPRILGAVLRNPKAKHLSYGSTLAGAYLLQRGLFLPDDLPQLMGPAAALEGLERLSMLEHIAERMDPDPGSNFGRIASLEASLYMRNQLLRDTDWASMAHSLEVRTPLVDAALLRQLAPLLMANEGRCKQFFAESPRPPLPEWLQQRSKTGFSVPLKQWLDLPSDGTTTGMRGWARKVMEQFQT